MRILLAVMFTLVLQGCVHATYQAGQESFTLWSFLKSVDGLDTSRGDFALKVDTTHAQDPEDSLLQLMELYKLLNQTEEQ